MWHGPDARSVKLLIDHAGGSLILPKEPEESGDEGDDEGDFYASFIKMSEPCDDESYDINNQLEGLSNQIKDLHQLR